MLKNKIIAVMLALAALTIASCSSRVAKNDAASEGETETETAAATETEAVTEVPELDYDPSLYPAGDIARVYIDTAVRAPYTQEDSEEEEVVNYALKAPTDSSVLESNDYPVKYLCDGNTSTRWSSAYEDDAWFTIDLGEKKNIGYVGINWEYAYGEQYMLLYSNDAKRWTSFINEDDGHGGQCDYNLSKRISARYIKFRGVKRATEYGYSIYEFVVAISKPAGSPVSYGTITGSYQSMTIVVVDKEGGKFATVYDDEAIVRVRGNSTSGAPKQPYNFKLSEGRRLLGMDSGRKWCLLANMYDKALMRNKISYDFTETAGVEACIHSRYCEVYVDGELCGNYILTEPVSDGRIKLDTDDGDYLLERNGGWNYDGGWCVSPIYGINFTPDTPDAGEFSSEQRSELSAYLKAADEALYSGDEEAIRAVFDIDSFVAMYVCEELFKDCDIYHGSTYHYIKDGIIYAGPMWDMDLSMGNVSQTCDEDKYRTYNNVSDYHGQSFGDGGDDSATGIWAQVDWYAPMMECEFFYELVVEKYRSLTDDIEYIYEDGGIIDQYLDEYGDSFMRNYEECDWSLTVEYSPYERTNPDPDFYDNVEWMRQWLIRRDAWLRDYFGID